MSDATDQAAVAASLLAYLANGGTLERVMAVSPASQVRMEAALERLRCNRGCLAADVRPLAERLREVIQTKHWALESGDFEVAAEVREEERQLFESSGLGEARGVWTHDVAPETQLRDLASALSRTG